MQSPRLLRTLKLTDRFQVNLAVAKRIRKKCRYKFTHGYCLRDGYEMNTNSCPRVSLSREVWRWRILGESITCRLRDKIFPTFRDRKFKRQNVSVLGVIASSAVLFMLSIFRCISMLTSNFNDSCYASNVNNSDLIWILAIAYYNI